MLRPVTPRLEAEAALLRRRFPRVALGYDTGHGMCWVDIPDFHLPRGWTPKASDLLIVLPDSYPRLPPNSFYLERGLRDLENREVASHYFDQMSGHNPYAARNWAWYCFHIGPNAWHPTASPLRGDSLLTYVNVIYQVLAGKWPR